VPNGKGWGERAYPAPPRVNPNPNAPGQAGKTSNNGIFYHGGPLILGGTHIYYIWYGDWSKNTASTILEPFAGAVGGSPYFNINTTYYDGSNTHVTNAVAFSGSTTDSYSQGTDLSDAGVQAVVSSAISSGRLPRDTNGVYFVLTSADVNETSGFCTQYCGWHTHGTISGSDIKYSFVGNPDRCPSACEAQTTSPNGNAGADGMASIIAHELEEATTDPDLNAWYDRRGYENADKCAWTFGTTSTASNGSLYNMTLNGAHYLIQRNWVNVSGGYCALAYP
jgi:Phosphate-induced protein 1 conserved region